MLRTNYHIQRIVGQNKILRKLFFNILCNLELLYLGRYKDEHTIELIRRVRREKESLLTAHDAYIIYALACAQSKLPGDMAEVGVYQGASAKLLCEAKGEKPLHLFDTFEGLPLPEEFERPLLKESQFASSIEAVESYLDVYRNVYFYKGIFPETSGPISDLKFSFVNLDVDLYRSTLECLEFFYPRMSSGGIILSHDYSVLNGVKRAFDEFFEDKPEQVVDLPSTQCMVLKLSSALELATIQQASEAVAHA